MNIDKKTYKKYANSRAPKSPLAKDCALAFLFGGLICSFAELLKKLYVAWGMSKDDAATLVSVTLIFISAFLTGIGVFDKIAKHAGGGTLVPITGFANSVVSPAIDTKSEGLILGVGAKMFTVAGPVIVYGTVAGVIYGIVYWICRLL